MLFAGSTAGQPADTVITHGVRLAAFEDARALAVDPAGILYVADAGRDVLVRLLPYGVGPSVLGGPGAEEGQFHDPSGIDPTNGLVLLVADAGNGRIQRFSREFLHLSSIPVGGSYDSFGEDRQSSPFDSRRGLRQESPLGRPIAVVSSGSDETYAIDEAQGVVLKWDASRRLERVIGGYEDGEGALITPVALALDPKRSLFVADRGRDAVVVYDLFGTFVRFMADSLARDVQALKVYGDHLWIVLPGRILMFTTNGRFERSLDVEFEDPLRDVAFHNGILYLLTARSLYTITGQ